MAGPDRDAPVGRPLRGTPRPSDRVTHKSCGHVSDAVMVCSACGERIGARDVRADPGPGAVESLIAAPKA